MRKSFMMRWVGCLAVVFCAIALVGCRSLSYIHDAPEDSQGLWMAALKHQEGPVYYVGSDGDYSYFRAGTVIYTRYKAQTAKIRLPRTFPFGKGEPYLVTEGMVPKD
jgi:hypothetical protein